MKIESFITNSIREKAYILYDENTKEAVCVDPGNSDDGLLEFVNEKGLNLKYILLTHGHFDHTMGVKSLAPTKAKVVAHKLEKDILNNPELNSSVLIGFELVVEADEYIDESYVFEDVSFEIKVLHTPGHTKGGCCYYVPSIDSVFTGDTLFRETVGRSDLYSGDGDELLHNIRTKLFVLDDETTCFPGHGENTTIWHEKSHNQFFR